MSPKNNIENDRLSNKIGKLIPNPVLPICANHSGMVIYKITNRINGKIYIGQTIRPVEKRYYEHFKYSINNPDRSKCVKLSRAIVKYGAENFDTEIVDTAITRKELNEKETKWIIFYDSVNNGYNLTSGGDNNPVSEETRKKLSEAGKGKKLTNDHIQKVIEAVSISVYQYTLEGFFLKEWKSATEACRNIVNCTNSDIGKCCKMQRRQAGGFLWRYEKCENISPVVSKKTTHPSHKNKFRGRKVGTIDMNGNSLKEYDSIPQAAKETGCDKSTIYKVCKGIYKDTKGIIFRYI